MFQEEGLPFFNYHFLAPCFWIMYFPAHGEMSRHLKLNAIWNSVSLFPRCPLSWVWIFAILSSHVNVGNDLLRLLPLSLEVCFSQRHKDVSRNECSGVPVEGLRVICFSSLVFPCLHLEPCLPYLSPVIYLVNGMAWWGQDSGPWICKLPSDWAKPK